MDRPFFEVFAPKGREAPVVVEVPHAGLDIPPEALATLVAPARAIARDADLRVDELYEDAPSVGATLLVARTSRYVADLNRAADDVDAGVVQGDPRPYRPTARGLVWRTTTEDEPALTRPLSRDEYQWRVDRVHAPYHQKLRSILDAKIARFGYVILLCGHSMPSVGRAGHIDSGVRRADVVPGTRGRTSCHVRVIAAIEQVATDHDLTLEHDRPYKGGYTTAHYGRPSARVHAIQIELARRLYLDETKLQRLPGAMEATQALCRDFVAALAELTAADLA